MIIELHQGGCGSGLELVSCYWKVTELNALKMFLKKRLFSIYIEYI